VHNSSWTAGVLARLKALAVNGAGQMADLGWSVLEEKRKKNKKQ